MTRRLILHIGRHKTGTKSLQSFFSDNDARLLEYYGLLYPKSGREYGYHHPVFRSLIHENRLLDHAVIDAIGREAEAAGADRVLLSSEMLSRVTVTESKLQAIRSAFSEFDITTIVYLRPQHDFLESVYAERVKQGLCAFPGNIHSIDAQLNYYDFVKRYATVFGKENMIVRVFRKGRDFNIFEDFLSALGCKWQDAFTVSNKQRNPRFPWSYVEILRYANSNRLARKLMASRAARNAARFAARTMPAICDRPRPLSEQERNRIMRRYEDSNARLATEYLGRARLFD